jgi:hypothetical protein
MADHETAVAEASRWPEDLRFGTMCFHRDYVQSTTRTACEVAQSAPVRQLVGVAAGLDSMGTSTSLFAYTPLLNTNELVMIPIRQHSYARGVSSDRFGGDRFLNFHTTWLVDGFGGCNSIAPLGIRLGIRALSGVASIAAQRHVPCAKWRSCCEVFAAPEECLRGQLGMCLVQLTGFGWLDGLALGSWLLARVYTPLGCWWVGGLGCWDILGISVPKLFELENRSVHCEL